MASAAPSAAAAAAGPPPTLDDRFARDQRSAQAHAAAARGLRILTLLKRYTSQAFSGIVLHGTEDKQEQQHQPLQPQPPSKSSAPAPYGPLQTLEAGPWGVRVRFRVPPHLCSGGEGEGEGNGYYLTCGAIMAWFDEVSSWAFICAHPRHRPGVSVSLTATVLRWARAGQAVVLESRVYKAGETLGFADITLKDAETGREMAHGRHVKFLVMGRAWDFFMSPLVFPVAHYFARRSLDRATFASPLLLESNGHGHGHGHSARGKKNGGSNGHHHHHHASAASSGRPQPPPPPSAIHLDALLGLEGFALTDDGGAAGAAGPTPDPFRPRPPVLKATARVRVTGRLCNNFNTLHGGAVSILAERMAARVWASARRMAGWEGGEGEGEEEEGVAAAAEWPHARTLSIDYMSPAPKGCEVVLEAWAAPLGPSPAPSPWPVPVPAAVAGMAYPPLSGASPSPYSSISPAPDDVGGDNGSWLPSPGLVRVWFRRGDRTLTQCHVQFDPPAARQQEPQPRARPRRAQAQPQVQPEESQPLQGAGGAAAPAGRAGSKRARRWSRL